MTIILQIEDNQANRILIERVLGPYDYELLHAATGEQGIMLAQQHTPDLILVDMGLPDIDGQTVVARLRQFPPLQGTPIVAITAWPPETAVERAISEVEAAASARNAGLCLQALAKAVPEMQRR